MSKHKKAVKRFLFHHTSNFHHFHPRSRIRNGDTGKFEPICNILVSKTKVKMHDSWHRIFLNMFSEEAIAQIKEAFAGQNFSPAQVISSVRKKLDHGFENLEITQKDLSAWKDIFGEASTLEEFESIIAKKWTYPGVTTDIVDSRIVSLAISLKDFHRKNIDTLLRKIFRYSKGIKIIPTVINDHENLVLKII